MKKLLLSALLAFACMISTHANAVSATFTLYAGQSASGVAENGYCQGGWCVYCDQFDPNCTNPLPDQYGALSNYGLSDGNQILTLSDLENTPNPPQYTLYLDIQIASDPGASYIHSLSINCDSGAKTFTPSFEYFIGGSGPHVAVFYFEHTTSCVTPGNVYSVTIN